MSRSQGWFVCSGIITVLLAQSAAAQDEIVLDEIVIEAESNETLVQDGYVGRQDREGTKIDTPIVRIPQAVSVITQDQIEDQEPRTLNEALTYTASANPNAFGFDSRYDAFYLRGFPAFYNGQFRDGLRQFNGPSAWFKTEPYGIEGVTVLKGPASSLYGISGPGGIVNIVTKRPLDRPYREVELLGGIHQRAQVGVDFSGPVNADNTLLYRFTGLGRIADTELPGYPDDRLYLAPTVTFAPDENTKLTVLGEYSRGKTGGTATYYNPSYGTASDLFNGDPEFNDFHNEQGRIGYEFEHRFNESIAIRQNLRYAAVDADLEYAYFYPVEGLPRQRGYGAYVEDARHFVVDNMVQFNFATGIAEHEAVVGLDYGRSNYDVDAVSFFNTVEEARNADLPYNGGQESDQVGIYLHDQVDINDLTLFGSARYDWVDTVSKAADFTETTRKDDDLSWRVGASYRTPWGLIPYANYSTSFSPNVALVFDNPLDPTDLGRPARPTIAEQKEVGVKYEIPDTNAVISAALFDISQTDGIVFDTSAGVNRQRQLDLNSRGFELETNASFDNGFSVIASYTHLRVEIDRGAIGTEGNELSSTPNDILSLWGHYDVSSGPLEGLGLGAGVRYVGKSFGDDQNSFENADRYFIDASVSYDFGKKNPNLDGVLLQGNVKNLFDERKQTCSAGYCYFDEGISATASLRYRF